MSCCGATRMAAWSPPLHDHSPATTDARPPEPVRFEYTGRTALTMRGTITGRSYRFAAPGEMVAVDARDAPGAAAVPHLRRARATV